MNAFSKNLRLVNHAEPVMIAESTPQRYDTFRRSERTNDARLSEAIWQEWYAHCSEFIYSNTNIIRGVSYINTRWDDQAMWGPPYSVGISL